MDLTSSLHQICPNVTSSEWAIPGGAQLTNPSIPGGDNVYSSTVFKADDGPGWIWGNRSITSDESLQILDWNVIGQSKSEHNKDTPKATPVKLAGVEAHECAMWFCLQAHYANVSFGIGSQAVTKDWNKARIPDGSQEFYAILNFTDIPSDFNPESGINYGVSHRAPLAAQ